jgi:hypothetical protein
MKPANDSHASIAARRLLLVAGAAGTVLLTGFLVDARRAWTGWLLGFVLLCELSLAGLLFLALLELAAARWPDRVRAVPAAMAGALPAAALAGLVLLLGVPVLYEWAHGAGGDPILERKAAWLNAPGFALRLAGCFAVWLLFGRAIPRRLSRPADPSAPRAGRVKLAAGFVASFAITWSIASVDWVQSLEPHGYSTVFALRTASGLVVLGLAAAAILAILLRDAGALRGRVTIEHVHDLAKLLLSFSIVWVYVWYCQYMLIWYTDIPEETVYYARRSSHGWRAVTWASLGLGFVLPFLALLLYRVRRSPAALLRLAFVLLVAQALDLYSMIGPALSGPLPALGPFELAGPVAALAFFFSIAARRLAAAPAATDSPSPREPLSAAASTPSPAPLAHAGSR